MAQQLRLVKDAKTGEYKTKYEIGGSDRTWMKDLEDENEQDDGEKNSEHDDQASWDTEDASVKVEDIMQLSAKEVEQRR